MNATVCPDCGSLLPPDAPQGVCPRCLLAAGYDSLPPEVVDGPLPVAAAAVTLNPAATPAPQVAVTRSYAGHARFQPLTVEELQAKIPNYEIQELIGQGGMGAVYKARQKGLGRLVAIKVLPGEISGSPDFLERFSREARALALLSHPHIVAVHDFGQAEGICYFVMEYVDGVNLRQALQGGKMDSRQALVIVPQICDALQFAHDEGVVHRDIKPENILIDKRGRVKIADFGLAKLLGPDTAGLTLTGTQQVMGTLRYMAPEQMSGAKEVDHRADIFSLGVVFYELLTGELPIGRFAPPSKKAAVDARLDEVVLRALEAEPELRYQQVSELKTGVEATKQAPAHPQPSPPAPARAPLPVAVPTPETVPAHAHDARFWGTPVSLALCLILTFVTLGFVVSTAPPVFSSVFGPDYKLIQFGRQWRLGDSVDKILAGLMMMFVPLIGATLWVWWKYQSAPPGPDRPRRPEPSSARDHEHLELTDTTNAEPRFSRAAAWGLALIPVFLLSLIMLVATTTAFVVPVRMNASGEAVTAARPMWIMTILMIPLLLVELVGLLSPLLTTILGVVAIGNIRHSRGKLYGMPLAVFDALLYPLLLLDVILFGAGLLLLNVTLSMFFNASRDGSPAALLSASLLMLPMIVVLDIWLVRLAWQAATNNMPGRDEFGRSVPAGKEPLYQPPRASEGLSPLIIILVLVAIALMPLILCVGVMGTYFLAPVHSPRNEVIEPFSYEHEAMDSHGEAMRQITPVPANTLPATEGH